MILCTMQTATLTKVFIVLAVSIVFTTITSFCEGRRTTIKKSTLRDSFRHRHPRACLFDYTKTFLKTGHNPPEACHQACRICMVDDEERRTGNVPSDKQIEIKVRLFKPWEPGFATRLPSKFENIKYQEGLESIKDFRSSLGPRAKLIRDSSGYVIGIDIRKPPPPITSVHSRMNWNGSTGYGPRKSEIDGDPPSLASVGVTRTDRDQCCETREIFFVNATLVDISGNRRNLLQYNNGGSYQFIRHGVCGGQGGCMGQCVQHWVNMALSIHPPENGNKATFKFFAIPGYCACKSFG